MSYFLGLSELIAIALIHTKGERAIAVKDVLKMGEMAASFTKAYCLPNDRIHVNLYKGQEDFCTKIYGKFFEFFDDKGERYVKLTDIKRFEEMSSFFLATMDKDLLATFESKFISCYLLEPENDRSVSILVNELKAKLLAWPQATLEHLEVELFHDKASKCVYGCACRMVCIGCKKYKRDAPDGGFYG